MFPSLGGFIFWLLWSRIVLQQTRKYHRLVTGRELSKPRTLLLKKELARLTRDIRDKD